MQVSFQGDVEDHVIIGGGVAQACSIDDTAEFLDMLSDTIYREKALAAVREPICNAWDAHIVTGKTDIPLSLTLTNEELTIRDYGPGIAPDKMHGIYCVYGRSTKRTDETQTGGFGIGSKAPWAYSKHFTVTSSYQGTRTIYAMSKDSLENDGKPDMRPITAVPCDQSGLSVTIPIKNGDRNHIEGLVRRVVIDGGMRATLNGELLPYRDYEAGRKLGFALTNIGRNSYSSGANDVRVLVGTVLYPLSTDNPEISRKLYKLSNFLPRGHTAILLSEPNTIAILPSREGLSYGDRTIRAVNDLLDNVISVMSRLRMNPGVIREITQKSITMKGAEFSISLPNIEDLLDQDSLKRNILTDISGITKALVLSKIRISSHDIEGQDLVKYAIQHLMRVDRSRKSFWRKMASEKRNYLSRDDIQDELFTYNLRLLAREAAKKGLFGDLTLFHRASFKKFNPRKTITETGHFNKFLKRSSSSVPIFVMGCQTGVIRDGILNEMPAYASFSRRAVTPVLQVSKDRKDEARQYAKFMEKIGFQVIDLLDVVPQKKPRIKKEEKSTPEKHLFYFLAPFATRPEPYKKGSAPKHFIHIFNREGGMNDGWRSTYEICCAIGALIPDTCLIFTAEAEKEAKKMGMTSAVGLALDMVHEAINKDTPAMFEFLRRNSGLVSTKGVNWNQQPFAVGLSRMMKTFPFVASVLTGKRTAHKCSEKDKKVGALMNAIRIFHDARDNRKFYARGENELGNGVCQQLAGQIKTAAANSRHQIDGKELAEKYPALCMAEFKIVSENLKDLPEKSVSNIIRAFMNA